MSAASGPSSESKARLQDLLAEIGVEPILHAGGTKSSMGGTLVAHQVAELMHASLELFVPMQELLGRLGDAAAALVEEAESAAVVAGAASGCVLAAAAARAATRSTGRRAHEPALVTQRRHVGRYTYLYEQAGCVVREVGTMNDCTVTDYTEAFDDATVAVAWLEGPGIHSADVGLPEVCAAAHEAGLPVVVDAAAMMFPVDNLRGYLRAGADLVVVSGGKLVQGPQASGFIFGRADLIDHLRRLGFPQQGVGRAHKVSKEAAIGGYAALRSFFGGRAEELERQVAARAQRFQASCAELGLTTHLAQDSRHALPSVVIARVSERTGSRPSTWNARLLVGSPRVYVPFDDALDELWVDFVSLHPQDDARVLSRLRELVDATEEHDGRDAP